MQPGYFAVDKNDNRAISPKLNLSLSSPYYAETCNELVVQISTS